MINPVAGDNPIQIKTKAYFRKMKKDNHLSFSFH